MSKSEKDHPEGGSDKLMSCRDLDYFLLRQPIEKAMDSINSLYQTGISGILGKFDFTREVFCPDNPRYSAYTIEMRFSQVNLGMPMYPDVSGTMIRMLPRDAERIGKMYSGALTSNVSFKITPVLRESIKATAEDDPVEFTDVAVKLFDMPIFTRSELCHTHPNHTPREELMDIGEDPTCDTSYIVSGNGTQYRVDTSLEMSFNTPVTVKLAAAYKNTRTQQGILSRPGDGLENSGHTIIRVTTSDTLRFMLDRKPLKMDIPLHVIFALFGMPNQAKQIEMIANASMQSLYGGPGQSIDPDSPIPRAELLEARKIADFYRGHLEASTDDRRWRMETNDTNGAIDAIVRNRLSDIRKFRKQYSGDADGNRALVRRFFDVYCLPHIGGANFALEKAEYICWLTRTTIRVDGGMIETDSRNDFALRRLVPPGIQAAKVVKTVTGTIRSAALKSVEGAVMQFGHRGFDPKSLKKYNPSQASLAMAQAITTTTSNEVRTPGGGKHSMRNHLPTSTRVPATSISAIRDANRASTGSAAARKSCGTENALAMRAVSSAATGILDGTVSSEGKAAGFSPQFAISARISGAGSVLQTIKWIRTLLGHHLVQTHEMASIDDIRTHAMVPLLSNGINMGYLKSHTAFCREFRELRESGKAFTIETSVSYNQRNNVVNVLTDYGRGYFPVFTVRNTENTPDGPRHIGTTYARELSKRIKAGKSSSSANSSTWEQWLVLDTYDPKAVRAMSDEQLYACGIITYLDALEATNCVSALDFAHLRSHGKNPLRPYTHVMLPKSQICFIASDVPFPNMNQGSRNTFSTNQRPQATDVPVLNWPRLAAKGMLCATNRYSMAVSTMASVILPSGLPAYVWFSPALSRNQEDSLVMSTGVAGSYDLFSATRYPVQIPPNARISNGTTANCINPTNGRTAHLVDGIAPVGAIVHTNDVLVAKTATITNENGTTGSGGRSRRDTSTVYKSKEPGIIIGVIRTTDDKTGVETIIFQVMRLRTVQISDKFSSRHGQKGVIGGFFTPEEMPHTAGGVTPSILINPHAIPSRMTIGQLLEAVLGLYSVVTGKVCDGNAFNGITCKSATDDLAGHCGSAEAASEYIRSRGDYPDGKHLGGSHMAPSMVAGIHAEVDEFNRKQIARIAAAQSKFPKRPKVSRGAKARTPEQSRRTADGIDFLRGAGDANWCGDRFGRVNAYYRGMPVLKRVDVGIVTYRRINKMGEDTTKTSTTCMRRPDTKQPVSGPDGGNRAGEMEVQALDADGASCVIDDTINRSDSVNVYCCDQCYTRCTATNMDIGQFRCVNDCKAAMPIRMRSRHSELRMNEIYQALGATTTFMPDEY